MITLGGKPRYEVRMAQSGTAWAVWDTERDSLVYNTGSRFQRETIAAVELLNREYQRWLTDRFYDRKGAA
jgi:hypothetical protein